MVVSNTDRAVRIPNHLLDALLKRSKKVTANVGHGNIDNHNCDTTYDFYNLERADIFFKVLAAPIMKTSLTDKSS